VVFGGAVFAAFPSFYATTFGWAYLVWMAILFLMIVQAVSYEYRSKKDNFLWKKTYDIFLFLNWLLVPLLLWVAVATFFTWSNFVIETSNLVDYAWSNIHISSWTSPFYGLEALWNTNQLAFITNISLGLAVAFLVQVLALLYVIHHINDKVLVQRASKMLIPVSIIFLIAFLTFVFKIMTISGFAVDWDLQIVNMENYKYFNNLLANHFTHFLFVSGTLLVLTGIWLGITKKSRNWFWISGLGTFFVVISLFLLVWLNNTSFYPSFADLESSLTIRNASSSHYTLIVMAYVSLMLPFVLAYIIWAWKIIAWEQMKKTDLKKGLEHY
jgi:cytochrome d ubiquinol oxidase subunit II